MNFLDVKIDSTGSLATGLTSFFFATSAVPPRRGVAINNVNKRSLLCIRSDYVKHKEGKDSKLGMQSKDASCFYEM